MVELSWNTGYEEVYINIRIEHIGHLIFIRNETLNIQHKNWVTHVKENIDILLDPIYLGYHMNYQQDMSPRGNVVYIIIQVGGGNYFVVKAEELWVEDIFS